MLRLILNWQLKHFFHNKYKNGVLHKEVGFLKAAWLGENLYP